MGSSAGAAMDDWANPTLNIGNNNVTFAGVFGWANPSDPNNPQGTFGFVKRGTGTLTIGGSQTYRGDTVINEGTLATSAADRIGDSSRIVIGSNGTFRLGGSE